MTPKRYAVAFILGAVVLVLSALGTLAVTPVFCGSCHGKVVSSMARSSHKDIPCQDCHQGPGVAGIVEARLHLYRMVGSSLFGSGGADADVQSSECLSCHSGITEKVITKNALRVRHSDFVSKGYRCTNCHNQVAHPGEVAEQNVVSMDACLDCHDNSQATSKCTLCHTANERVAGAELTSWRASHGSAWKYTHPQGDETKCVICHGANFCSRCHGIDLPHPDSWLNLHGAQAKAKTASCLTCHTQDFCLNCHKTTMPHPADFLKHHPDAVAKSGKPSCLACHIEGSCDSCHAAHVHPGLDPARLKALKGGSG